MSISDRMSFLARSSAAIAAIWVRFPAEHLLNFSSFLFARVVALGLFAWSVAYYLSVTDASSYGEATLLLTVLSLLQASDLGLAYAFNLRLTRELTKAIGSQEKIIRGAIPFYLVTACAVGVAMASLAPLVSSLMYGAPDRAGSLRYLALAVSLSLFSSFFSAIVQAFNKLYLLNASRGFADALKAGALCLAAPFGIERFAMLLAFASLLKLIVDFALAARLVGYPALCQPKFSIDGMREDLRMGLPMFAAVWLSMAFTVIDKIYISRVFGAERLGYYSMAYDLSSKAFFLAFAVTNTFYVVQVRRLAAGRSPHQLIVVGFAGVCVVGALYYLPLAIFAPDILRIWINPELSGEASGVTRAAVAMAIAYLVMNVFYGALQAAGRSMLVLSGGVIAVIWLAFGLWTMPRSWGDTGVMLMLSSAFAVQAIYYGVGLLPVLKSR